MKETPKLMIRSDAKILPKLACAELRGVAKQRGGLKRNGAPRPFS